MQKQYEQLGAYIVDLRRRLHRIPEPGTDLPQTQALLCGELDALGIPYTPSTKDSGIIATIQGGAPGKTLVLRADMDALPVTEATGLPFASQHPGSMHACGHDAHMAMLMGAAKHLQENRGSLKGSVRLLFQTGEELAVGAEILLEQGVMEGADAVFGTHIGLILGKEFPSGTVISVPGCCMASFDKFVVRVKGTGCHGSMPETGVDPIHIAAQIVLSLEEILAREIKGTDVGVLTIGHLSAGHVYNVIPDEALLEGTIRTLDNNIRLYLAKRIEEVSKGIAAAFRADCEVEIVWGAPPVVNDPAMAQLAADVAKRVVGEDKVVTQIANPSMVGEDFAYFLLEKPGAFLLLSSADAAKGTDYGHHNPRFDVDEDVLWEGAAVFIGIAEELLK